MNESRNVRARPPIVKMTRALVSTAVQQRQPRMALQLMTSGLQAVRALPAPEQFDIAVGIVEEVTEEFRGVVGRRLGWAG
jgi:hypothetical protein